MGCRPCIDPDLANILTKKITSRGITAVLTKISGGASPAAVRDTAMLGSLIKVAVAIVTFTAGAIMPLSAADDITLELMASKVSTINGEFTGHAFMCLALLLNSGIKEDCYGFYPRENTVKGYIGGPGVVDGEFQKNPSRFTRITQSLTILISDGQRRTILGLVNEWNTKNYDLTRQQCVDFVRAVATAAGLKVPPRNTTDFPVDLLTKVKNLNP